jgi:hypothetical protein
MASDSISATMTINAPTETIFAQRLMEPAGSADRSTARRWR